MDKEKFEQALQIREDIEKLTKELRRLSDGQWNDLTIELPTGYYNNGDPITRYANFTGQIGVEIGEAVKEIVTSYINELETRFNEL